MARRRQNQGQLIHQNSASCVLGRVTCGAPERQSYLESRHRLQSAYSSLVAQAALLLYIMSCVLKSYKLNYIIPREKFRQWVWLGMFGTNRTGWCKAWRDSRHTSMKAHTQVCMGTDLCIGVLSKGLQKTGSGQVYMRSSHTCLLEDTKCNRDLFSKLGFQKEGHRLHNMVWNTLPEKLQATFPLWLLIIKLRIFTLSNPF